MTIDWGSLGLVAVVTIVAAAVLVGAMSLGFAVLATAQVRRENGSNAVVSTAFGGFCLVFAAALILYGLYLIIPQFHGG